MYSLQYFISCFALCLFSLSIIAQTIPVNFELLDHREVTSNAGVSKITNEGILYVSHNTYEPMTTVNIAKYNNDIETILEVPNRRSSSKLFIQNDSTYKIALYQLIDYDVISHHFYIISFTENPLSWEIKEYFFQARDIAQDSTGSWWCTDASNLYKIIDENTKVDAPIENVGSRIFNNSEGELFIFNRSSLGRIYKLEVDSALLVQEIGTPIIDIKSFNESNFVLLDSTLIEYDLSFINQLNQWPIPEINSFKQIEFSEDKMIILTSSDTLAEVQELYYNGQTDTISNYEIENEKWKSINKLSDNEFLITGNYVLEEITDQIFFRNIGLTQENNYERVDISVETFTLVPTPTSNKFDYTTTIKNTNTESVSNINCFSEKYGSFPFGYMNIRTEENLEPNQSLFLQGTITTPPLQLGRISLGIPGGGYRFNSSEYKSLPVTFLSDSKELTKKPKLLLYPNPSQAMLQLFSNEIIDHVSIYDYSGKLVLKKTKKIGIEKIDVSILPSGYYYLNSITKTGKFHNSSFIKN